MKRLYLVALIVGIAAACATPAFAASRSAPVIQPGVQPMTPAQHPGMVGIAGHVRTLFFDTFEAGMNAAWTYSGDPYWGITTYAAAEGTTSAYCVGSSIVAPGPYPATTDSWMMVGPFDLSHYTDGVLHFRYKWSFGDGAMFYAVDSFDQMQWNGLYSIGTFQDWDYVDFSLGEIANEEGGYGVLGRSQVWFAFVMQANASTGEGSYIDDVAVNVLDTTAPVPKTPYAASVRRYRTAYLKFKVVDPDDTQAKVTIKVRNASGTVVKTLGPKTVPTGVVKSMSFACKLKKGTYKFIVTAKDVSGNAQIKPAVNKLVVK